MASTVSLKLGTICLVIVFILHAVGCGTPKWAVIDLLGGLASYHTGLWQQCTNVLGGLVSGCSGRNFDEAAWFRATQVLEAVGVLGLFICGIISLVLVCSAREKSLRLINIILMLGSALCIIVGVVVFAVELTQVLDAIFPGVALDNVIDDKLGYSFFLSAVAGGLCLFICVPLFILDYRQTATRPTQQLPVHNAKLDRVFVSTTNQPAPAPYSNQGRVVTTNQPAPVHYPDQSRVIISQQAQPQVMQYGNYHPYRNAPAYTQEQNVYYVKHGVW